MALMQKSGMASLVEFDVGPDSNNPQQNVLRMFVRGPGKGVFQTPTVLALYQGIIAQMFQIVLGDEDVGNRTEPLTPTDINQEWLDAAKMVIDFETDFETLLANVGTDLVVNLATLEELNAMTPSVDWPLFVNEVLPAGVQYNRPIVVYGIDHQTTLETILNQTSTKALQYYFSWIVIKEFSP
ncbi:Endothelin-converting enzyme 1, partial [Podila minutissima]